MSWLISDLKKLTKTKGTEERKPPYGEAETPCPLTKLVKLNTRTHAQRHNRIRQNTFWRLVKTLRLATKGGVGVIWQWPPSRLSLTLGG